MQNNISEITEYIYKNFTPTDLPKAVEYYCNATGADSATAKLAVEKIFQQRANDGMVLPMPKEWTPAGQKYASGQKMFQLGCIFLVLSILFTVGAGFFAYRQIRKAVNEVTATEREYLLSRGCQEYKTHGEAFELIENYAHPAPGSILDLYLFHPQEQGNMCLGVLSSAWWYHYDEDLVGGLDFFYRGTPEITTVETDNGTSYEVMIVDVEDIEAGYGIASEESKMNQTATIVGFSFCGAIMIICSACMIIAGKKKMKKLLQN